MVKLYANDPIEPKSVPFVQSIGVVKLDPRARIPEHYDEHSIGLDVFAFLLTESGRATSRAIHTQGVTEIPTGIKVYTPPGYFIQVSSRLSLSRSGILVANAPAIISEHFDSELTILLVNTSYKTQYVAHEHRVAQLTLQPIIRATVQDISTTQRPEDVHSGPRQGNC